VSAARRVVEHLILPSLTRKLEAAVSNVRGNKKAVIEEDGGNETR
jgi:hypothetical protein